MASKKNINDMFLTAKDKSANDFELGKKMIDTVDGMLRTDYARIRRINENWHLHSGIWPELAEYLASGNVVLKDKDGENRTMNLNDFIVHHPKINNITNYIMGDIIMQPLIPVIRDFSSYGRKYREEERLKKLKSHYYETIYTPQAEAIRSQYMQENGITDMMALGPDEQRQVQSDLQQRLKSGIPRSVIDDLKKIKTPDEKIRQVLLDYDIKAYKIEEKFAMGGEQAVVSYEEYYKMGRDGVIPTVESLNSKWVRWAGSDNCDYSDDGSMATYEQYLTPHDFIMRHGRAAIEDKNFMKDIQTYFTEVPGFSKTGFHNGSKSHENTPLFIEAERDFVDMIGENPRLIQNDWRTLAGQQEIAGLYGALSSHHKAGFGIREVYVVFKWSEMMTYVQREENGKLNEYYFSADYTKDKSRDKMVVKFPANRVYHGTKISNRLYAKVEPVPWQYYGGIHNFESKLTICGRKYSSSNGNDEDNTLIGPAIQYQLRFDISASKLEDLEKNDLGKIVMWDQNMIPPGWEPEEYVANLVKTRNVPYTSNQIGQDKDKKPLYVEDAGSSSKLKEYRESMDKWEREMYKAMRLNMDTIGLANQYQSNALTQSNIQGSQKQLLPFHNKRRLLKERVLNQFSTLSMICFTEDVEKQLMLLDDFSRMHLQVNAAAIKASNTALFVVDDFDEAQNVKDIKAQILTMLQKPGTTIVDVIDIMGSKSVPEMRDIAEVSEIKTKEDNANAQQARMEEIKAQNEGMLQATKLAEDRKALIQERKNQVNLLIADAENELGRNAADVDKNNVADSLQRADKQIESTEKIEADKRAVDREKIDADIQKAKITAKKKPS